MKNLWKKLIKLKRNKSKNKRKKEKNSLKKDRSFSGKKKRSKSLERRLFLRRKIRLTSCLRK
jgi:hypothetical protein